METARSTLPEDLIPSVPSDSTGTNAPSREPSRTTSLTHPPQTKTSVKGSSLACIQVEDLDALLNERSDLLKRLEVLERHSDGGFDVGSHGQTDPPAWAEIFFCPITLALMTNPVCSVYGHFYDQTAITEWIELKGTCPITCKPLTVSDVFPCYALKSAIMAARMTHSSLGSCRLRREATNVGSIVFRKAFKGVVEVTAEQMRANDKTDMYALSSSFIVLPPPLSLLGLSLVSTITLENRGMRDILLCCYDRSHAPARVAKTGCALLKAGAVETYHYHGSCCLELMNGDMSCVSVRSFSRNASKRNSISLHKNTRDHQVL
mmetsp:Transcript_16942/g.43259  ORF Transcript_16942/g.43259 Transcript_16942/m.43259 type:complete len:320 (+) Transcript_16942:179-1138(+)